MNTQNQLNNQSLITGHLTRLTLSSFFMHAHTYHSGRTICSRCVRKALVLSNTNLIFLYILKPQYANTPKIPSTKCFAKDGRYSFATDFILVNHNHNKRQL